MRNFSCIFSLSVTEIAPTNSMGLYQLVAEKSVPTHRQTIWWFWDRLSHFIFNFGSDPIQYMQTDLLISETIIFQNHRRIFQVIDEYFIQIQTNAKTSIKDAAHFIAKSFACSIHLPYTFAGFRQHMPGLPPVQRLRWCFAVAQWILADLWGEKMENWYVLGTKNACSLMSSVFNTKEPAWFKEGWKKILKPYFYGYDYEILKARWIAKPFIKSSWDQDKGIWLKKCHSNDESSTFKNYQAVWIGLRQMRVKEKGDKAESR